jgi:hypothetical protein
MRRRAYYEYVKGRRSDAEAANREIENSLYLKRAHSLGARRQLFDLIGYALAQNSLARYDTEQLRRHL